MSSAKAAIINDTAGQGHHGCDLVMDQIREGLAKAWIGIEWTHPVGRDWRPYADRLLQRPPVDVLIVNGEGSIHHSASRPRAVYLPEIGLFARDRLKIPAFLINATITEIDDRVAQSLRSFEAIYVRENASRLELNQFGIRSHAVPDLTLGADLPGAMHRRGICGTDSVLPEVSTAIRNACAKHGWPFRLMKQKALKRRLWWPRKRSGGYREFAAFLSSHELVVTGRFHTVTMCLATRTPFVAIESNTAKISWLLDDVFGDRRRMIGVAELEHLAVDEFRSWTETEWAAIESFSASARDRAAEMFTAIEKRIGLTRREPA